MRTCVVESIKNLSDPVQLVADLACRLQWCAFENGICKFCGGVPSKHAKDCVLGRARYFLDNRTNAELMNDD